MVNTETSINYLTKKKIIKENTNDDADGGDEVFKETVTRTSARELIKLSKIKDFDDFDGSEE